MRRFASHCGIALFSAAMACGGLRSETPRGLPSSATALAPPRTLPSEVLSASETARSPEPKAAAGAASAHSVAAALPGERGPAGTPALADIERSYPLHGLATYMMAQVYSEPSERGIVIGYLRRGGRLRAKPGELGTGCDTRWYAVLGGGFVCEGRSFLIGETPPAFEALPVAPALYDGLPYAYAKITAVDAPLYYRAPTPDEERALASFLAQNAQAKPSLRVLNQQNLIAQAKQNLLARTKAGQRKQSKPSPLAQTKQRGQLASGAKQFDPKPSAAVTPTVLPDFVRMLMQPGFYVSVDGREETPDGGTLLRTVRGNLARTHGELDVHASTLHGVQIEPGKADGLAFVYRSGVPSFQRDPMTGVISRATPLHALEALTVTDEVVRDTHHEYRVTRDGRLVPSDALRIVPSTPRPPFVPSRARYIAVQLSTQTLVAYDGPTPVFATLVSTGKPEHETPTGIYRILQKHVSATMDAEATGADDAYSIEDVPWTMYFSRGLALHAAFWHEGFGRPHSHGCVNLAPLDARWLFEWTAPNLPVGFHGVFATRENPGTFVVITP
jgi:hypothetical protein